MDQEQKTPAPVHSMETSKGAPDVSTKKIVGILVAFVVGGILTGFVVSKFSAGKTVKTIGGTTTSGTKTVVGLKDKKAFTDSAEGLLREGGFEGEGSYHLERPGGDSQNVYLTSSAVDLSSYIGKKIKVWGETFTAEKAGWLMDVGLVEASN